MSEWKMMKKEKKSVINKFHREKFFLYSASQVVSDKYES